MATSLDVKKLFAAGAHFGHRTSRWHPKMAPYIHSKRGGVHIIDLTKTVECLNDALGFLRTTAASGKAILFVGTKRQLRPIVLKAAASCSMPYVTERWLGGLLTNFPTISGRVNRLKQLESQMASGELSSKYSKLELQRLGEEIEQLEVNFGGVKGMGNLPAALFVVDVHGEQTATREANKLGIPVVGIVDSNADPTPIDYPIPANDDAIKTVELIASEVAEAVQAGKARIKPTEESK